MLTYSNRAEVHQTYIWIAIKLNMGVARMISSIQNESDRRTSILWLGFRNSNSHKWNICPTNK